MGCEAVLRGSDLLSLKGSVKPYRVGMSCAFCHVGPNPVMPPENPEHPEWKHLSSNVGAQYFWIDRIFSWEADETSFPYQLFHTSRPGALDTSLVSTDYINNPRTMNAVYALGPRLEQAKRWGQEKLSGDNLNNKQLNDYVAEGPLTKFFQPPDIVLTPRVLKDGSDSVGRWGRSTAYSSTSVSSAKNGYATLIPWLAANRLRRFKSSMQETTRVTGKRQRPGLQIWPCSS
jgi:hypothetical protein